ncbi:MAG TPA: DUF11 domain-containing protein [Luteimonas sp.]|nr:DUF11 domain-containing protein [Luteimonas sp.]
MKASPMTACVSRFRGRLPGLLLVLLALAAISMPVHAQRAFGPRYSTITGGDIAGIGNINMHCDPTVGNASQRTACLNSRTHTDGSGGLNNNTNGVQMIHNDVDSDPSTFNSSIATLNLPAGSTVLFAGLYWSAQGTGSTPGRNAVRFATPASGYSTITASQFDTLAGSANRTDYQGFANVTAQVQAGGSGAYTVANIASGHNTANNTWAGWSLVVVYRNSAMPPRSLSVFDGWMRADGSNPVLNLAVGPFVTPPTGPVNSKLGVLTWDGDRATNDHVSLPGLSFGPSVAGLSAVSNAINPVNNFWNSTISVDGNHVTAGRTPAYTNTLGMDLDYLSPNTPLPNGATAAAIRLRGSSSEVMDIGMVSLVTDVYAPDLVSSLGKTAVDVNGGAVEPGDVLTYTVNFTNSGQDGATNVVITDPIPAGTTYVAGSLEVLSNDFDGSGNAGYVGPVTDGAGDDVGEYDAGNNRVVFRLGSNDAAHDGGIGLSNGGMISAGNSGSFRFQVTVDADVAAATTITNTAHIEHNAQTLPDFDASGEATATVTTTNAVDLGIAKSVDPTSASSGDEVDYRIVVTNEAGATVTGATVTDSPGTGLDCPTANLVSCTSSVSPSACPTSPSPLTVQALLTGVALGALPVGETVTFEFSCTVE